MKRAFLFAITAVAALLAASCQKEDLGRILTATIEQYEHNAKGGIGDANGGNGAGKANSKAYINNDYYACWENGDIVSINGTPYPISISQGEDHNYSASIPGTEDLTERPLLAFYPASQVSNLSAAGGTVSLPRVQTYEETTVNGATYQKIQNPMAAYCPEGSDELRFRNLCALLKVTITANTSVKAIQVKGYDDQMLWGEAPLRLDDQNLPTLGKCTNGSNSVVLNFTSPVPTNGSKSFYIVVPAVSIFSNLTIAVLTANGVNYTHHCKTSNVNQALFRNQIGGITYSLDHNDDTFLPCWMIRYTATQQIAPYNPSNFGARLRGYFFESPNGSYLFDGPVTSIGNEAFKDCADLTSISLPESVTSIGNEAFKDCADLSSVSLPAGLTSIGNSAFSNCSALSSIALPDKLTSIGNSAFSSCSALSSIALPANLTTIEGYAFYRCSALSSITLPANLTSIEGNAFYNCSSLASISLPKSLTEIGDCAFNTCTSLARVDCHAVTPPSLGSDVFYAIPSSAELHVPGYRVEAYSGSDWGTIFTDKDRSIIGDLPAN